MKINAKKKKEIKETEITYNSFTLIDQRDRFVSFYEIELNIFRSRKRSSKFVTF